MNVENEEMGKEKDDSEFSSQGGSIPRSLKEMRIDRFIEMDLFRQK